MTNELPGNWSQDSIELVSVHQKACLELAQEGNHDELIRSRLALLKFMGAQDAEIARLKATSDEVARSLDHLLDVIVNRAPRDFLEAAVKGGEVALSLHKAGRAK